MTAIAREIPARMDLVRFYIVSDPTRNGKEVIVVARDAQGTWWNAIVDWHGVSSIDPIGRRPSMTSFKPYVLVEDLADVEPVFADCRDTYARRVLDDVGLGLMADFDPGVGFLDATVNDSGVLCVLSKRPTLKGEELRTYTVLSPGEGVLIRRHMSGEEPSKPFRDGLKEETVPYIIGLWREMLHRQYLERRWLRWPHGSYATRTAARSPHSTASASPRRAFAPSPSWWPSASPAASS